MKYKFPAIIPIILDKLWSRVTEWYCIIRSPVLCWLWGIKAGPKVVFQGKTVLRTRGCDFSVGKHVVFNSDWRVNLVGLMSPTIIDNRRGGKIVIGDDCGFSSVIINSSRSITIGNRVLIGGNVRIFDHDFHSIDYRDRGTGRDWINTRSNEIVIGDDVFIGTNAIILKGTHIGDRSIISAGSVVFGLQIPPDSFVKGNPATILKRRNEIYNE